MFQVLTVAITGTAAAEKKKCEIGKMFIHLRTFTLSLNVMNYIFRTPRTKRQYFSNAFALREFRGLLIKWNNDNKSRECRQQLKGSYLAIQYKSMKFYDENKRSLCKGMDTITIYCNYTKSFR